MPTVLNELQEGPIPVLELFGRVRMSLRDATDFISVMDCLYALRAVDIDDDGEVFL